MATAEASLPPLDEVRPQILKVLDFLAEYTPLTDTTVDDRIVAVAREIVQGALFGFAWNMIRRRINRLPEDTPEATEDASELGKAVPPGMSVFAILAMIQAAWKLIQFLRSRNA